MRSRQRACKPGSVSSKLRSHKIILDTEFVSPDIPRLYIISTELGTMLSDLTMLLFSLQFTLDCRENHSAHAEGKWIYLWQSIKLWIALHSTPLERSLLRQIKSQGDTTALITNLKVKLWQEGEGRRRKKKRGGEGDIYTRRGGQHEEGVGHLKFYSTPR